ncbi:hypothetical protein AB6Y98_19250 [Clostridioides difficile]
MEKMFCFQCEQTAGGKGLYTHGELLPAHAYPKLKEYKHLKGNFGTAWQNQQKEFDNIPAPILFTTNCLMPVKDSYRDRVFTTEVVAYPGMVHIDEEVQSVCILLTLLHLGIKNIYIGPSLPAFLSKNVLDILVDKFALTPISTPEEDMKKILG